MVGTANNSWQTCETVHPELHYPIRGVFLVDLGSGKPHRDLAFLKLVLRLKRQTSREAGSEQSASLAGYQAETSPILFLGVSRWDPTGRLTTVGDAIGVEVGVTFDNVSWLPIPEYLAGVTLRSRSVMRREASQW